MKKFIPWLLPMILILGAVPVLLIYNVSVPARIAGVVLVVLVSIALRFWLYNAGKLKKGRGKVRITINERHTLKELYPSYERISSRSRNYLEERMGLLLAELSFDTADHSDASRENCLLVTLVFAFLTEKEPYVSATDKVVVFSDITNKSLHFQENHPVLFISKDDLIKYLDQFNYNSIVDSTDDSLPVLLLEFYRK